MKTVTKTLTTPLSRVLHQLRVRAQLGPIRTLKRIKNVQGMK